MCCDNVQLVYIKNKCLFCSYLELWNNLMGECNTIVSAYTLGECNTIVSAYTFGECNTIVSTYTMYRHLS